MDLKLAEQLVQGQFLLDAFGVLIPFYPFSCNRRNYYILVGMGSLDE